MSDAFADLLAGFARDGTVPFSWAVEHAPDGDLDAAVARAWRASDDPDALVAGAVEATRGAPDRKRAFVAALAEVTAAEAVAVLRAGADALYVEALAAVRAYGAGAAIDRDIWRDVDREARRRRGFHPSTVRAKREAAWAVILMLNIAADAMWLDDADRFAYDAQGWVVTLRNARVEHEPAAKTEARLARRLRAAFAALPPPTLAQLLEAL